MVFIMIYYLGLEDFLRFSIWFSWFSNGYYDVVFDYLYFNLEYDNWCK